MKIKYLFYQSLIVLSLVIAFDCNSNAQEAKQLTAVGTTKTWGTVDGVAIEGMVQGPSATETPLQVACVFEYTEGDIYNPPALPANFNGMVHLDKALHGIITELRKSGKFTGHAFETILITVPLGSEMKAKQLLLIGLGDRNQFHSALMKDVGIVAVREALRLKVSSFAFAADIKDAGIDSETGAVAGSIAQGIIEGYRTQTYLKNNKLATFLPITKVTLLAGPAFFADAGKGIQNAINSFKN